MLQNDKKIGLVLSGGGYRGIAHVGTLKAMEELGLKPDYISGTSAGAIVGALYSAGHSCSDILEFFNTTDVFSFKKYAMGKPGILDSEKFKEELLNYFPEDSFEALKIPMFITTSDLIQGKTKYFHQGELITPLIASAALPWLFSPVPYEDCLLCDGGVTNNFPIEPVLPFSDILIGVYVNHLTAITREDLKTAMAVTERAYKVIRAKASEQKFSSCDILISPQELTQFSVLSNKGIDQIYQIGYDTAKQKITEYLNNSKKLN